MNIGFNPEEIAQLRAECIKEGKPYVLVEDEDDFAETGQAVHFQFVGLKHDQEVIYDVLMTTLEMEYQLELYDTAVEEISEELKLTNISDEAKIEEMLEETMNLLEEEGAVKVAEQLNIDADFEYGIGVEYVKNIPVITDKEIRLFIQEFSTDKIKLDKTLYSFESENE
ncbi:MAG: hypothetical protein NWQ46_01460 [Spirosomaceae bacterium]|nr:hypothetical protein [Spirosomataceae bacterium]